MLKGVLTRRFLGGLVVAGAVGGGVLVGSIPSSRAAVRSPAAWDDSTTTVESLCLSYLPDGGARARVTAGASLTDGGQGPYNPQVFELAGAAQTTALNALGTARTAWISAQGAAVQP
jgi:hypothetical protein